MSLNENGGDQPARARRLVDDRRHRHHGGTTRCWVGVAAPSASADGKPGALQVPAEINYKNAMCLIQALHENEVREGASRTTSRAEEARFSRTGQCAKVEEVQAATTGLTIPTYL